MPDHVYRIIQVAGSSQKSIEDLALLLHLRMQAEKLSVDGLDATTPLVFFRPSLPSGAKALVGARNLRVILDMSLD